MYTNVLVAGAFEHRSKCTQCQTNSSSLLLQLLKVWVPHSKF